MASRQATKRLNKEFKSMQASPPPFIIAKPTEENILEWHYVITGPPESPYEGGQYHGIIRFPTDYPFKPPSILMITPNGRFSTNTRLCLSMSDYHPDTWNPAWSVATILNGLLSFMTGSESTTGSIQTSDNVKRRLAKDSKHWNAYENDRFKKNFSDLVRENKLELQQQAEKEEEEKRKKLQAEGEQENGMKKADINVDELDPEDRIRLMQQQEAEESEVNASRCLIM
ncbi:UBC6 Ubiquitin-conjugating enzyme E2 6 [Candida maltosa Xu316]|uniref:Ubiquitin-conjugating enzyme E2 6 n=1 Tax=Candida maltosa (strain Xu316) TaxID=1245528 RepID=M3K5A9_CANMX|nr:Ubiquitin-conjugating enzyme E2 6 [Candida maltosa Xu316]